MKSVPILTRFRLFSKRSPSSDDSITNKNSKSIDLGNAQQNIPGAKLKLNSMLQQISDQNNGQGPTGTDTQSGISELEVAAIAAGIYTITGKKTKRLIITAPTGTTSQYNLWGVAGRQDLMLARDISGQVGFQY